MKILCLASNYPPYHAGGYGLVAQAFCEGLASRGHEIGVLTREPHGEPVGPGSNIDVIDALKMIDSKTGLRKLIADSKHNLKTVRDVVAKFQPDLVFSCGNDGIGYLTYQEALRYSRSLTYLGDTWLAQAWRSLPDYDSFADVARGGRTRSWKSLLKIAMAKLSGLKIRPLSLGPLTVISQFVLDDLRGAGALVPEEVAFTYIPLNERFFDVAGEPLGSDGSQSPALRALFVSRIEKLKGPDAAIEAVAKAVKQNVNVTLTIAGLHLERMKNELQAQAAALGIADRVRFAGTPELQQLIPLYRSHDVFLFPSRIVEGLGVVNCEAQACGLPIIGTADSGAAEVIHHGKTGFRVAIDDTDAMARHIAELADNPEMRQMMSLAALQSAKRFHPKRILDTLEQTMMEIVNEPAFDKRR